MIHWEYVAVFRQAEDGWSVTVPDLPGCFSCGDTLEEAQANIKDAIEGMLEVMLEHGQAPPPPTHVEAATVSSRIA